jgi:hypothetical protein
MYSFAKKNLWDVSQNNLYQQFVMQIVADPIEFHVTPFTLWNVAKHCPVGHRIKCFSAFALWIRSIKLPHWIIYIYILIFFYSCWNALILNKKFLMDLKYFFKSFLQSENDIPVFRHSRVPAFRCSGIPSFTTRDILVFESY